MVSNMVSNDLDRVIPQEIISCVMLVSTKLTDAQESLTLPMSRMIVELPPPLMRARRGICGVFIW